MGSSARLSLASVLVLAAATGLVVWTSGHSDSADGAAVPGRALVLEPAAHLPEPLAVDVSEAPRPEPTGLCPDTDATERSLRAQALTAPYGTPSIVRGVVRRDQQPVAGLEVRVSQWGGDGARGVEAWERLVTDEVGSFEGRFPAGATIELRVLDDQFGSGRAEVRTTAGSIDEVELVLERPKALVGWVRDAQSRPVANATVLALRRTASSPEVTEAVRLSDCYAVELSDAEGAFELPLRGDASLRLSAHAPTRVWSSAMEVEVVDGVPPPPIILRFPD